MKILLVFLLMWAYSLLPFSAYAHELIPPEALEYIKEHPDATTEEIQQFIEQQSPGFTRKFKDKQEALGKTTSAW